MIHTDIRRTQRSRAAIAAEKLRRSTLDYEFQRIDEQLEHRKLFETSCYHAIMTLKRTPLGLRHMIESWEHLERKLAEDGTWYSADRLLAIELSGLSPHVHELFLSEDAYGIWRDALAAQPAPKQSDIDVVLARDVIPKSLQDRNTVVWPVDPEEARARLHALVERALARYRPMEEWLRENIEEPEKAAIDERALARLTAEDQRLLQALRSHEQSYHQATTALAKLRRQSASTAAALRPLPAPKGAVTATAAAAATVRELAPAVFLPEVFDASAAAAVMLPATPSGPVYRRQTGDEVAALLTEWRLMADHRPASAAAGACDRVVPALQAQDSLAGTRSDRHPGPPSDPHPPWSPSGAGTATDAEQGAVSDCRAP